MQGMVQENTPAIGWPAMVLLLASSMFFTGQTLVVKLTADTLTAWEISVGRFTVGMAAMLWLAGGLSNLWGQSRALLTLRGMVGTMAFLSITRAVQLLPMSQAMVLFFTFPMFSAIHGRIFFGQKVPAQQWVFVLAGIAGAALVIWPQGHWAELGMGHALALVAAVCSGLALAMVRRLRAANSNYTLYFYFCMVGAPVSLGPMLSQASPLWPGWVPMAAMLVSALLALLGQLTMNQGLKDVPAHTGGVILSSQVVFSSVLGVLLLGEEFTWRLVVGAAMIMICGVMLGRNNPRPRTTV